MKKSLLCLILLMYMGWIKANDSIRKPLLHSIDWKLLAVNSSISVSSILLRENREALAYSNMKLRQKQFTIPFWDWHRKKVNESWQLFSDVGVYGSFVLPMSLFINQFLHDSEERKSQVVQYVEVSWLSFSSVMLLKYAVFRPRPFTYGNILQPNIQFKKSDSASFVSGHTAMTASNCMFFYLNNKDLIESQLMRRVLLGISLTLPAFVGYARMEAGQHFLTDVLAGYLVGMSSAYLVFKLHHQRHINISTSLSTVGVQINF